ncbi:MAG: BLUF domain-containing protein [Gammaproteobacteria bacterium]|nr:BLUF domain-containing protein [Gammaproteobacteria bacterium]
MLTRLLYASRATDNNRAAMTDSIMQQSKLHNPDRGITGILCYGGDIFMQVLEGGRAEVNELYGHILRDTRHCDVMILRYEEITERRFSGWTMGQVNLEKINPAVLLKYSAHPTLDPYSVSGDVSMALLEELISTAAIIGRV